MPKVRRMFEFKKQINNRGCYCRIYYEISQIEQKKFSLVLAMEDKRWGDPLTRAADYYFERLSPHYNNGIELKIVEVHWMPVDTRDSVVFYTLILLLTEETGFAIPGLRLSVEGQFIIP